MSSGCLTAHLVQSVSPLFSFNQNKVRACSKNAISKQKLDRADKIEARITW